MRDLRVRFGYILSLALLPLLTLSIWNAVSSYEEDRRHDEAVLLAVAKASTLEVVASINNLKATLGQIEGNLASTPNCQNELQAIANLDSMVDNIIIFDAAFTFQCSAFRQEQARVTEIDISGLTPENAYKSDTSRFTVNGTSTLTLKLTRALYDDNKLTHIVMGGTFFDKLPLIAEDQSLTKDTNIALINDQGDILVDPENAFADFNPNWITSPSKTQDDILHVFPKTQKREQMFILPTTEKGVLIAVRKKRPNLFSWQLLNPLTSGLLPLLTWLFAFIAIWISADRLILIHLRKLQRTALLFGRGDKEERVGDMDNAPEQIAKLGRAFDLLADRVTMREAALTSALAEKETLLREIHHRVKNNLQIIISLLNLQDRKLKDPAGKHAIGETRNRVTAISLVHKGLYEGDDLNAIEMERFLSQLSSDMSRAMQLENAGLSISLDIQDIMLDPDTAVPVGLFMIEALSNAKAHGGGKGGIIHISLHRKDDENIFKISDPAPVKYAKTDPNEAVVGTGYKLMKGFARQLSGAFKSGYTETGFEAILKFPTSK